MKWFSKLTKKFTKTASETVKTEVKKKAVDLLPLAIGVGGAVVGLLIYKKTGVIESKEELPAYSSISITTNNYYFGNAKEDK